MSNYSDQIRNSGLLEPLHDNWLQTLYNNWVNEQKCDDKNKQPTMTVKNLKELIADAPDDMEIYIYRDSYKEGVFFQPVYLHESGMAHIGLKNNETNEANGFILMPSKSEYFFAFYTKMNE